MKKQYRVLLFDADNTLLDFDRAERDAFTEAMSEFGISVTDEHIRRYSEINDALWKQLERGETTREALKVTRFFRFLSEYGFSADAEAVAGKFILCLSKKSYLISGAYEVCTHLCGKYGMYVITNGTSSVQHGRFDPSPLFPLFDGCFISEEMGAERPSGAFFEKVLSSIAGVTARDCLVIGDSLTSDIRGGVNAGMDTCWFNPKHKENTSGIQPTFEIETLGELTEILSAE